MTSPHLTDWGIYGLADIWNMVRSDKFDNFNARTRLEEDAGALPARMADSLTRGRRRRSLDRWPPRQSRPPAAFADRSRSSPAESFT